MLGENSSPAHTVAKSKHGSSSSDRKSSSHSSATATVPSGTGRNGGTAGKPSASTAAATVEQSGSGVVKGKNVCVVEPQSTNKATAVVAPLQTESRQFTKLFGEPIVKSDVSKKNSHQKVSRLYLELCVLLTILSFNWFLASVL